MSRYCHILVIVLAAALAGCGGGQSAPRNAPPGTGNAAPATLQVSNSAIDFGNVDLGTTKTQTASLTASGSAVTVSSGSWNGNGFSLSGITFPTTIGAGQNVSFTVSFTPQTSGATAGGVSFISNAANSPTSETFTGHGQSADPGSAHSVSLSWSSSPSTVIGYNVYRGTISGGPYPNKLTPAPQTSTSLDDDTVMPGTTYYYVATSVDPNLVESVYSNQFTVTIP